MTTSAPVEIRSLAVLGAGTMGSGIAQIAALAGLRTALHDADPEALRRGLERARAQMDEGVRRGKLTEERRTQATALLSAAGDLAAAVREVDLVIEAVPERLELKQRLFAELGTLCAPPTLLATNTSSLSISAI